MILENEVQLPTGISAKAESYTQRRDDHRQELHYHNCLEIGLCDVGEGVQFIGNEIYTFTGGSIALIPSGCVHDSHIMPDERQPRESRWRYIFVDAATLGLTEYMRKSGILYNTELSALFEMMYRELSDPQADCDEVFPLLLHVFLCKVNRLEIGQKPIRRNGLSAQMTIAVGYIAQHYATALTVTQLAQVCNMSDGYFRRVFHESFGVAPQQYIIDVRLRIAERLLKTTEAPILQISQEAGFHTLSSFNRLFKKKYGIAPRQMRNSSVEC